jgi:hypothetical protein
MRIVAHSSHLRGSVAMKTKTSAAQFWTAPYHTIVASVFHRFSISVAIILRVFPETHDFFGPSAKPLTSHLPLKTYHFDSHNTHTIKTHYNTIIPRRNSHLTHVIPETYDFFDRNLQKIFFVTMAVENQPGLRK